MTAIATVTITATAHSSKEHSCTPCLARFPTKEAQRAHMRTDWHVSNLKRRIASVPAVSLQDFNTYLLQKPSHSSASDPDDDEDDFGSSLYHYPPKRKSRDKHGHHEKAGTRNRPSRSAERGSRRELWSSSRDDLSDETQQDSQDAVEEKLTIASQQCLFCDSDSGTIEKNMAHMTRRHGFFIRDVEMVEDVEALLVFLATVVGVWNECLWCGKRGRGRGGVQDHMRRVGHCRVEISEGGLGLEEFYMEGGKGRARVGGRGDEVTEAVVLIPDGDSLRLPSGKTLCHRSAHHRSHLRPLYDRLSSPPSFTSPSSSLPQQPLSFSAPPTVPTALVTHRSGLNRTLVPQPSTALSLLNVPALQLRALLVTEKQILRAETSVRNEYRGIVEGRANQQKRYRARGIGKKRGGLEKRVG